jgi:hypothetical protein
MLPSSVAAAATAAVLAAAGALSLLLFSLQDSPSDILLTKLVLPLSLLSAELPVAPAVVVHVMHRAASQAAAAAVAAAVVTTSVSDRL